MAWTIRGRKNKRRFRVVGIEHNEAILHALNVEEIRTDDFLVFRTKKFLPPQQIKDFQEKVGAMFPDKKVLIFPPIIEVCQFVEEEEETQKEEA